MHGWEHFKAKLLANWRAAIKILNAAGNNGGSIDSKHELAIKMINMSREVLSNEIREDVYWESGQRHLLVKHSCEEARRASEYLVSRKPSVSIKVEKQEVEQSSNHKSDQNQTSTLIKFSSEFSESSPEEAVVDGVRRKRSRLDGERALNVDTSCAKDEQLAQNWPTSVSLPLYARRDRIPSKILHHRLVTGKGLKFLMRWSGDEGICSGEDTKFVIQYPALLEEYIRRLLVEHPRRVPYLYKNAPEIARLNFEQ